MVELTKDWLELADAIGVSGAEETVRQLVQRRLAASAVHSRVDALGNLIAPSQPGRDGARGPGAEEATAAGSRVVISAPLDEPGLVVTHIEDEGWLRVDGVGGPVPVSRAVGRWVDFQPGARSGARPDEGRRPVVRGLLTLDRRARTQVVGREDRDEGWQVEDLFADIGAPTAQAAADQLPLGSTGVLAAPAARTLDTGAGHSRWAGRAVGRRLLVETLLQLGSGGATLLFAAQSLLGGRGVEAAMGDLQPQYYLPLLPVPAEDWPASPRAGEMRLGAGPVIVVQEGPGVSDRGLLALAERVAAEQKLPVQWRVGAGGRGSKDPEEGLWARGGGRTLGLGLVVRMETGMAEIVDARDAEGLVQLLHGLVQALRG